MIRIAVLAVLLSGLGAGAALAQERSWDLRLGAGAIVGPAYEGSDRYKVSPFPFIQGSYRDRVLITGPILGANLISTTLGGGKL
ncbi:MAG: MipA/OmpV family protein, partial [Ferrovibrionaceae bacterium]